MNKSKNTSNASEKSSNRVDFSDEIGTDSSGSQKGKSGSKSNTTSND